MLKRPDPEGKWKPTTDEGEGACSSFALLLLSEERGPQKEASFAIASAAETDRERERERRLLGLGCRREREAAAE